MHSFIQSVRVVVDVGNTGCEAGMHPEWDAVTLTFTPRSNLAKPVHLTPWFLEVRGKPEKITRTLREHAKVRTDCYPS